MNFTYDQFAELYNDGILLVPTAGRGQYMIPYSAWREKVPDWEAYQSFWISHPEAQPEVLCGSGKIVAIDIDEKNKPGAVQLFESELRACLPGVIDKMYIEQTASGGRHYFFLADDLKSEDIAFAEEYQEPEDILRGVPPKWRPFVEYKGKMRLCRTWPCEGIEQIQGNIFSLQHISPEDVAYIKYIASLLNERPTQTHTFADTPKTSSVTLDAPGADYNERAETADIVAVLESAGWTVVRSNGHRGRVTLRRPGAKTKGVDGDILNRVFASRSSSVGEFEPHKGYSPFAVYAIIKHNGDFVKAASQLKKEGWGKSVQTSAVNVAVTNVVPYQDESSDPLWDMVQGYIDDIYTGQDDNFSLYFNSRSGTSIEKFGIMAPGLTCVIAGREKARKTSFATSIAASAMCGEERAGWTIENVGGQPEKILWVDTEQPMRHVRRTLKRIWTQVKLKEEIFQSPSLIYLPLKRLTSPSDKIAAIEKALERHPDISMVFVDGIRDLVLDFNNIEECTKVVSRVMSWAHHDGGQRMLFLVIHMNKQDRELRGHLGSFLAQKCDVRIDVTLNKDTGMTDVEFPLTRDEKPEPYSFYVVGNNIPMVEGRPAPAYPFLTTSHQKSTESMDFLTSQKPTDDEIEALYNDLSESSDWTE